MKSDNNDKTTHKTKNLKIRNDDAKKDEMVIMNKRTLLEMQNEIHDLHNKKQETLETIRKNKQDIIDIMMKKFSKKQSLIILNSWTSAVENEKYLNSIDI